MSTTQFYVNIFLGLIAAAAIFGMILNRNSAESRFANLVGLVTLFIVISAGIFNLWLSVRELDATVKQTAGRLVEVEKKLSPNSSAVVVPQNYRADCTDYGTGVECK